MSLAQMKRWHQRRLDMGEAVGGGFIVLRRGKALGRISIDKANLPFEHASLQQAETEAGRLASFNPGQRFDVWQMVATINTQKDGAS